MAMRTDTGELLDRARRYQRQGRSEEAAAAFAGVADALEARADWPGVVAVRARQARALADAGRAEQALRLLADLGRAAAALPAQAAEPRAILDDQAAHVLARAGRDGEGARRAWAAMTAFRALGENERADRAGVHAARLIVRDAGERAAIGPLRELLGLLPPGGEGHGRVTEILARAQRRPDRDHDVLVADPGHATWGRLAAALAVGAHLAVGNGVPWNVLEHGGDPAGERTLLERDWGVTGPASWREQIDRLLAAENSDPAIQIVLDRRQHGMGPRDWRDAIVDWCAGQEVPADAAGELVELSALVLRYEARFRSDGLLPPDGRVDSVFGYDFGRAVNMARWGLGARFCDAEAAEEAVLRAGRLAGRVYRSWREFSAGYVLGRMLRFDEGEFGEWYERSLAGHRILTQDPASPWRLLAWG
ncbi:DUF1266 domain-containing protein [Actinomadura namibiensis]|uniref:DUF1266 domain-containing protein n=2 Tax=Actinomadura TaxID=1988 RepID=A0A7W3QMX3_ACTNM|nr:DUF1266 domain-containing protein [Actinomadura namibiensis]MBA8952468.1 hypothetical protein [Actinomadura namibiensis]